MIAGLVLISFASSYAAEHIPVLAAVSSGTRTIILTVILATTAALLFPRQDEAEEEVQHA